MLTIMYEKLKALAQSAINEKDIRHIYRIIGKVEMAYELGRLTWSQMNYLTDMLEEAAGEDGKEDEG